MRFLKTNNIAPQFLERALALAALLGVAFQPNLSADESRSPVSFRIDVMAALSKAGCNMGVCHGNKYGKGGFKLSLRGDDPDADFTTLTRDGSGRRGNPLDPDRSLLLLKSTMQVPHEGGGRFKLNSGEYDVLRRWIAAGLPADPPLVPRVRELRVMLRDARTDDSRWSLSVAPYVEPAEVFLTEPASQVQLQVSAEFTDGTRRDVTRQATYEVSNQTAEVDYDGLVHGRRLGEVTVIVRFLERQSPVRVAFVPARPDFAWSGPAPTNIVDRNVFDKLWQLKVNPSPLAGDAAFLRRAYLDLLGLVPSADEARRFVADRRPGKRAQLIDELLERPEFADCWALKWSDLLRNEEKTLDRKGVQNFHAWIRHSIASGQPLDEFVRELISSRGSTYSAPASNYWRAMREPLMRAESTAQVFLGIRLQCAKCHSHPFDRWTQDDYYGWSNLFARVDYRVLENRRRDSNDTHEFDGEQIVFMARQGEVDDPRRGKPAAPRFLSDYATPLAEGSDRLLALTDWLTRPDNRLFVESQVNRIWFHLMGQGIVDPIDDFRATNPPSNPQLLAALAREFVDSRFDLRHLIRTIMNSHTYQASSVPNETNRDDVMNFSHAKEQRLAAEPLIDALCQVTGVTLSFSGFPAGLRAGELPGVQFERERNARGSDADLFLRVFGKPLRLQSCECERSGEPTLGQAFQLVSGELINKLLVDPGNRLGQLLSSGKADAELIDELYWAALSRGPSSEEQQSTLDYLAKGTDRRSKLEDVLWSLLNSNEFLLRQ
ncbi:MAG: DUF1549 domain-containing protein [Planctomycetaceae bacterium]|nr:DUF1549 domain-containing protein [Planctomycetaceae bacterium]